MCDVGLTKNYQKMTYLQLMLDDNEKLISQTEKKIIEYDE